MTLSHERFEKYLEDVCQYGYLLRSFRRVSNHEDMKGADRRAVLRSMIGEFYDLGVFSAKIVHAGGDFNEHAIGDNDWLNLQDILQHRKGEGKDTPTTFPQVRDLMKVSLLASAVSRQIDYGMLTIANRLFEYPDYRSVSSDAAFDPSQINTDTDLDARPILMTHEDQGDPKKVAQYARWVRNSVTYQICEIVAWVLDKHGEDEQKMEAARVLVRECRPNRWTELPRSPERVLDEVVPWMRLLDKVIEGGHIGVARAVGRVLSELHEHIVNVASSTGPKKVDTTREYEDAEVADIAARVIAEKKDLGRKAVEAAEGIKRGEYVGVTMTEIEDSNTGHEHEEKTAAMSKTHIELDETFAPAINKLLENATSGRAPHIKKLLEMYGASSDSEKLVATIEELKKSLATAEENVANVTKKAGDDLKRAAEDKVKAEQEVAELREKLGSLTIITPSEPVERPSMKMDAEEIPACKITMTPCDELFDVKGDKRFKKIMLPKFEWKEPNPFVQDVDPHYEFEDKDALLDICFGLASGQPIWHMGPTGCGKSSWYSQVSGLTGWMYQAINMDADIGRMEIVGQHELRVESGASKSEFVMGALPRSITLPVMFLAEEDDYAYPANNYVFQRVLENKGMMLNEMGGKFLAPDPWFRFVVTANTTGRGDDTGIYPGAKVQSAAYLDRFTIKVATDYLSEKAEQRVVQGQVPGISNEDVARLCKFAREVRRAFMQGETMHPISLRGLVNMAKHFVMFGDWAGAVRIGVLNGASAMDAAKLKEIAQSVFGVSLD